MTTTDFQNELTRYFVLWRQCNAMYERWSKKYGFSCNEILVLNFMFQNSGCTQKNISENLSISKQTVNMILKRFEKEEYVKMTTSRTDKRSKLLQLTEKGIDTANYVLDELVTIEMNAFKQMGYDMVLNMNNGQQNYIDLFIKCWKELENNSQ